MSSLELKFNSFKQKASHYVKNTIGSKRIFVVSELHNRKDDEQALLLAAVDIRSNNSLFKDLLVHVIFFTLFLLVIMLQLNPNSVFKINDSIKQNLIFDEIPNLEFPKSYMEINNQDDFEAFLTNKLPDQLQSWAFNDYSALNRILGNTIRIRQARVLPDSCPSGFDITCYSNTYNGDNKAREPFGPDGMYTYTPNTGGSFIFGQNQYVWDRSGYYVDIPIENITTGINSLITNGFFNQTQTRAVMISFISLNLSFQTRATSTFLLTEWTASGQVLPYYSMRTFRIQMYLKPIDTFRAVCEIFFFILLVYYVFNFIKEAYIHARLLRLRIFFFQLRNLLDLVNFVLFITSIGLYLAFLGNNDRDSQKIQDIHDMYPTYLENLGQQALVLYQLSTINVLLLAFKTFRFLIVHKRLYVIWITLSQAKLQLITFTVMFIIVLIGFLLAGWATFGTNMGSFNGFVNSLGTLLQFIIGNPPDYEEMSTTNRALGPIYYLLFTIFVFFILVNVFVAIISNSYQEVSETLEKQKSPKEYMLTKYQRYLFALTHFYTIIDITEVVKRIIELGYDKNFLLKPNLKILQLKMYFESSGVVDLNNVNENLKNFYVDLLMKVYVMKEEKIEHINMRKEELANTSVTKRVKSKKSGSNTNVLGGSIKMNKLVGKKNLMKPEKDDKKKKKLKLKEEMRAEVKHLNDKVNFLLQVIANQNNLQIPPELLGQPPINSIPQSIATSLASTPLITSRNTINSSSNINISNNNNNNNNNNSSSSIVNSNNIFNQSTIDTDDDDSGTTNNNGGSVNLTIN